MPEYKPIQKIQVVDGVSGSILSTGIYSTYYIYGTATLSTNWAVTMSGTAYEGMKVKFEYRATVTLSGNHITFLGTQMPDAYASKKVNVDCYYNGSAWVVDYQPSFDEAGVVTATMIDTITVAQVTGTASKVMEFTAGGVGQASTTTTTELGYLAGTTPGTVAVNKAIVPTTGKVIDEIDVTTFKKGGVAVTSTAAELNKLTGVTATTAEINVLAGVTAGTAAASKAVVLSAAKKIDELDATVLKINGTAVAATATELSELNGAGVVHLDFHKIAGLDAAGVTAADLALLAGAASAGVTASDVQNVKAGSTGKVQTKVQAVTTNADIDTDAGLVYVDLSADTTLTIPSTAGGATNQFIHVIVRKNPTATHDIVFSAVDTVWNQGSDTTGGTITFGTVAIGTVFHLINTAAGVWLLEKAS